MVIKAEFKNVFFGGNREGATCPECGKGTLQNLGRVEDGGRVGVFLSCSSCEYSTIVF